MSDSIPGRFYISSQGELEKVFHCSSCKQIYLRAKVTVEGDMNGGVVIGRSDRIVCCGKAQPTPWAFETVQEARDFCASGNKACLIPRQLLEYSIVNPKNLARIADEMKRKLN